MPANIPAWADHHVEDVGVATLGESKLKSALRADSFLARLSNESFDAGMAGLRAHAAEIDPGEAVTEEIDWFVFSKQT